METLRISTPSNSSMNPLYPCGMNEPLHKKQRLMNKEQLDTKEDIQQAMAFVQKSKELAKRFLQLQRYDCAIRILVKVEATTRLIAKERRRQILVSYHEQRQLNNNLEVEIAQELRTQSSKPAKTVCFADRIAVANADDYDRSWAPIDRPTVEEMLVVRACRNIPPSNE